MKNYKINEIQKRCRNSIKKEIVICSFIYVSLAIIGILCFIGICNTETFVSAICFALTFIIFIGIYVFFSLKKLKETVASYVRKIAYADEINSIETELQQEIESSDIQYGTFYLLDNYFYVPKSYLIIKYHDIAEFKNIIHSTNGIKDSVFIVITDVNNIVYEISVKKWRDYYKRCSSVASFVINKQKN